MNFLEAVARRWVEVDNPNQLIFRGSLVTGIWVGRDKRICEDIDFLATFPFDEPRLKTLITEALSIECDDGITFDCSATDSKSIFVGSDFPGSRITVPARSDSTEATIQIDIGFNDPLPFGPIATELETECDRLSILAPHPEVGFAWKLHGLVEKEGFFWRIKDLADLWLMANHCRLDSDKLDKAIDVAFESRDGPLWRLDRLFKGKVGHSRGSRKDWAAIREAMPQAGLPDSISEACELICPIIEPHWWKHRVEPSCFASGINLSEVEQAIEESSNFERYTIPDIGTTFVYRHLSSKAFPDPLTAATETQFRQRQILRELRGITFNDAGNLICRPFPKFAPFNQNDLTVLKGADTYEKLDGSLVFPTPTGQGFVMRTRRGQSEISQQALRYLEKSEYRYHEFIEHCHSKGLTPLFEWCSRQHRIIIDHPVDQLVLTSIRDNHSGVLLEREKQQALAGTYQIPAVKYLGKIDHPEVWMADVVSWKNREGCIVHTKRSDVVKVKSTHYKRLHQAIEGPNRDRSRWQLILNGDAESLVELSNWKGIELADYQAELFSRIAEYAEEVGSQSTQYPDRKALAEGVRELSGFERQAYFRLHDQSEPVRQLERLIAEAIDENLTQFNIIANLINGPLFGD